MSMCPDNYDRWVSHQAEQDAKLAKCPICDICGEPIQGEYMWDINDDIYCEDCKDDFLRDCRIEVEEY